MTSVLTKRERRMIARLLFFLLISVTSTVTAKEFSKLIVVHSSYCGHCQRWISDVSNALAYDAKSHGINNLPKVQMYDVTESEAQHEIDNLSKNKVIKKPVEMIPMFIMVNEKGEEAENCRMVGYSDKEQWYKDLKNLLERCGAEKDSTPQE